MVKYTTEEILSIIFYFLELNLLVGMQLQFVFCKTKKMLRNGKLFSTPVLTSVFDLQNLSASFLEITKIWIKLKLWFVPIVNKLMKIFESLMKP